MSDLVGSVTSVSPSISSGESYGVNLSETSTYGGSYAPINGNPPPTQCGGKKKRRRVSKKIKNKKNRKSKKNKTMKRKTAKRMRKNKKRKN